MDPATYITDKANKDKADKACFAIHYNCNRIAGFPHVVSIWPSIVPDWEIGMDSQIGPDWQWVDIGLAMNVHMAGIGLTTDWRWIGTALVQD